MVEANGEILEGGLMNAPILLNNRVNRKASKATETIHHLLKHVRKKGLTWVPEPLSFDSKTEVLSYIKGEVPHNMPEWIWDKKNLREIAIHMRNWHDATVDFTFENPQWNLSTNSEFEVICHNDFAPYNCVFDNNSFVGLIDFDLCAPGSRIWDMSYTAYRFIPVMPSPAIEKDQEQSPFDITEIYERIDLFLYEYSNNNNNYLYTRVELLTTISKRLLAIAEWTKDFAENTSNSILRKNAVMYEQHSKWINSIVK